MSAPAASTHRAQFERAVARRASIPAWTLTAAFGLACVIVAPLSTDLAAAGYRSDLFSRAGFTLWDNGWYSGHHVLAYSLLAPALSALLSPQLLAALSMTAAAALFAALIDGCFAARAARDPNGIAVVDRDGERRVTNATLAADARRVALFLAQEGIEAGDVVIQRDR